MNIPAHIINLLDKKDVTYEIEPRDPDMLMARLHDQESPDAQFVLITPVSDTNGKLQLIHSANVLVDIDALSEHCGPDLHAVSSETTKKFMQQKHLDTLPAIPQLTGDRALVDKGVLDAKEIYMHSGRVDQVLKIPGHSFKNLIDEAEVLAFGIPLSRTTPELSSSEHDIENIHYVIRKYTSLQIQRRLTETLEIPPLSRTAQNIISLAAKTDADAEELVKIIELDPSLSAQIVGWAASPYYLAPGNITSIHDAIVRVLGFNLVLNLAMGLALGKSLKIPAEQTDSVEVFWKQSIYTALTMDKLNRAIPSKHRVAPGLAYLSGLLNNFGYLILAHVFPTHFSVICRYIKVNRHLNPMYVEQYLLGLCRHQICSQLMKAWNLPESVCTALRFQLAAEYSGDYFQYANLCLLAKRLLAARGIGDLPFEVIPAHLYERLNLQPGDAEAAIESIMESSSDIDAMIGIFSS